MLPALLQLSSPALPIGAYSYSSGLEWAIDTRRVHDPVTAEAWIHDALCLGLGRFEAPLWAAAHAAWDGPDADAIRHLNALAIAARETAELRLESEQTGFSLRAWCREVLGPAPARMSLLDSLEPLAQPVVAALAARSAGLSVRDGLIGWLWSYTENQVMVLMKALPMGQIAAQKVLHALARRIEAVADAALALPPEQWSSAMPGLTLASMQHETQYSRLFRS